MLGRSKSRKSHRSGDRTYAHQEFHIVAIVSSPDTPSTPAVGLAKSPTGIDGLDEVTAGGLPAGRPTLVCGGAGCGKTLLATEFLLQGAVRYGEPGVFLAFEERPDEIADNVRSLGYDLPALVADGKLLLEYVDIDPLQTIETGEYNLDGLFIRLGHAIDTIGAKRVVLDTIESLFGGLTNHAILRAELRRLFRWLKDRGITAIITCERGEGSLTRYGIEEYVSDCVILLDHRVIDQLSTRRLRVVKYRGSSHGTNEYPFLIDQSGLSVLPITSVTLDYNVRDERVSTGVRSLDELFEGHGYFVGSTVLVAGTAGTGKTTLVSHFADAMCARGEQCLYVGFEESPGQLRRNMLSVGIDLARWEHAGLLHFESSRPSLYGYEMRLAVIQRWVTQLRPQAVILDPITGLFAAGAESAASAMMIRLLDFLKGQGITALLTSLIGSDVERDLDVGVSSLVDTWMKLRDTQDGEERHRSLTILKSRGMAHSRRTVPYRISPHGIDLLPHAHGLPGSREVRT